MSDLDLKQREHELAKALITLLIAVSRYDSRKPCTTKVRLCSLERIVAQVADGVEERVRNIRDDKTATGFRAPVGRRGRS